jgi:two-component system, chemotaxis family, chemotaxis protein CheY
VGEVDASTPRFALTKILAIDDSSAIRSHIRAVLDPCGYQVIEASDGVDALEKLRVQPEIALILCDVDMPRLDGFGVLDGMAKDPCLSKIPFIMLTSQASPEMIKRARAAGAPGWIVKPGDPQRLLAAVRKLAPL